MCWLIRDPMEIDCTRRSQWSEVGGQTYGRKKTEHNIMMGPSKSLLDTQSIKPFECMHHLSTAWDLWWKVQSQRMYVLVCILPVIKHSTMRPPIPIVPNTPSRKLPEICTLLYNLHSQGILYVVHSQGIYVVSFKLYQTNGLSFCNFK